MPMLARACWPPAPACSNTALAMCGLVRPIFRLPYVPLSREQREKGAKLLRAVQEHIPGCKVRCGVGPRGSAQPGSALPLCAWRGRQACCWAVH